MTVNIPLICRDFKMSVWYDPPKFHISQLYKSLLLQIILLKSFSVDKMKWVPTNGPLPLFSVRTMEPDNLINNLNGVLKLPIGKCSSLHFFGINSCLMKLTGYSHLFNKKTSLIYHNKYLPLEIQFCMDKLGMQ